MQRALATKVVTLEAKARQEPQQVTEGMHKLSKNLKCYVRLSLIIVCTVAIIFCLIPPKFYLSGEEYMHVQVQI